MKGYNLQATQNPTAASRRAQIPKTPVNVSAKTLNPASVDKLIKTANRTPIRAAKSFGPALIGWGFALMLDKMNFETIANGLHCGFSIPLTKKSANKKSTMKILEVTKNNVSNMTVKNPFNRATFSSIFMNDIGQNALLFIPLIFY